MNTRHSDDYLVGLVREFCKYPRETEWVEFKRNNADPQQIGENISALANSAVLEGKPFACVVWGIRDEDHAIEGTRFDPRSTRVGQEELENWLFRLLEPKLDFRFVNLVIDGRDVVVLEISGVTGHPVRFSGREFVRVGSYVRPLREFPEKERALWRAFDRTPFEEASRLSGSLVPKSWSRWTTRPISTCSGCRAPFGMTPSWRHFSMIG